MESFKALSYSLFFFTFSFILFERGASFAYLNFQQEAYNLTPNRYRWMWRRPQRLLFVQIVRGPTILVNNDHNGWGLSYPHTFVTFVLSLPQTCGLVSHGSFTGLSGGQTTSPNKSKLTSIRWFLLTNKLCFAPKEVELVYKTRVHLQASLNYSVILPSFMGQLAFMRSPPCVQEGPGLGKDQM